jgi:hypothetical protein
VCSRRLFALLALLAAGGAAAEELPVRDPMRPFSVGPASGGATPSATGPRFALTGVVLAPERRVAVVNGKPYLLGDKVAGAKIVAIEPNAVRLDDGGREVVIHLGRTGNVRPANVQGETVP